MGVGIFILTLTTNILATDDCFEASGMKLIERARGEENVFLLKIKL